MADLRLDDIGKTYSNGVRALDEVSFSVASGEYLALVGPSGCGKTTLLRVIAGLESEDEGILLIDDQNIATVPSERRQVGLMFQRSAFLLRQSVRQNLRLAWTLREPFASVRRLFGGEQEREADLARVARLLGLEHELDRPVQQLSGGQQQRVALGRCLLRKSKITLLDEPLGHLDAPLRTDLRRQIRTLAREFGLTVIHVTHDPAEALAVGDRVAVMHNGRVLQIDPPRQLRRCPNHQFVAELLHHETGGFNRVVGEIIKEEFDSYFECGLGRWQISLHIIDHLRESLYKVDTPPEHLNTEALQAGLPCSIIDTKPENFASDHGKVDMMIGIPAADVRCTTAAEEPEDRVRILVRVKDLEFSAAGNWVIGSFMHARGEACWVGRADDAERFERGQEAAMLFSMNDIYWFDAANGRTLYAPKS